MVDPTFLFVILFGGALVGFATARVRGHSSGRTALDIAAGVIGGFFGTPLWIAFVQHVLPRIAPPLTEMPRGVAFLLSDIYYMSPIVGGLLAVATLALINRLIWAPEGTEPWLAKAGDGVKIIGIVYLIVSALLTVALTAVAAMQNQWGVIAPAALILDLAYGAFIVLTGWAMVRASGRTA